MAAQKRFRPAGHTSAPALPGTGTGTGMGTGTGGHVSFDVPSSSAGAPPADIRPAVPAAPPPAPGPDPVDVANPVAGTGATAYPSDLPPITTLSMLRTQPPFAWKLDLPGRLNPRMTPIGGPLLKQCPLHLLPGGRGEPVVPGSVDHDEDLPLFEEKLVPPLHRGLHQRRSRLDVEGVLGGEGHEAGDVAAGGVAIREGSMSGAVETSVCGIWSPDSAPDTMREHGISNKSWNRSGTRSCVELRKFLIRALCTCGSLGNVKLGLSWG